MAKRGLTVAKATPDEFDRVWDFVHSMESLFDGRSAFSSEEDWRDWDDDDKNKQVLLKIEQDVLESDGDDWNGHPDNRLVLYGFMKRKFLEANYSGSIGRILFNCQTLIKNCCDPDLDYLEFKPGIMHAQRMAVEQVENVIDEAEQEGRSPEEILASVKAFIEESKKEED